MTCKTAMPIRTGQLAGERRAAEGMHEYRRRCWEVEFKTALQNIEDVNVRNALLSLYQLMG